MHVRNRPIVTVGALLLLALAGVALSGCQIAGIVGEVVGGGEAPPIEVAAEYTGLDNQVVAVLVNADPGLLLEHPNVQLEVGTAVTQALATNVPGISVVDPTDVIAFQNHNIYWNSATYAELARKLRVNRIVMIDLSDFRLQEPGNSIMYRGVISARVEVAEADHRYPDTPTYASLVTAAYPPDNPFGVPEADPASIRKGALDMFSRAVSGKF